MSWQAVTYATHVLDVTPSLTTAQRLVLLVIAEHANRAGVAWPSVDTIAARCGLHPGNVRRAVRALEDAGAFTVAVGGGRSSSRYRFPVTSALGSADEISTPRAVPRELGADDPAHQRAYPAHQRAGTPRVGARGTIHGTGQEPAAARACGADCPRCEGTGWEEHPTQERTVMPCTARQVV